MHCLRAECSLYDNIGFGKAFFDAAECHFRVAGDVAIVVFVELRGIRRNRRLHVCYGGKHFVLHINERERFFCGVRAGCGNGSDCVPFVEDFLAGEDVVAEVLNVHRGTCDQHTCLVGSVCKVGGCNDRLHIRVSFGFAGVDRDDVRVSVGAAQYLAVEHAGQVHIRAIQGFAGYFVVSVVADWACTDYIIFLR